MGVHDGHRERLKDSFNIVGMEGKTEHQALELLLGYAIPRIDLNPLAHELIDKFGSFSGVLDADIDELMQTKYITRNVATLLRLIPALSKVYHDSKCQKKPHLNTYSAIKDYMVPKLIHETNEVFYVLCLDVHLNLIRAILHTEGSPERATIEIRTLVNEILKTKACQVILVHNHLSGSVMPSSADIVATQKIADALAPLEIKVLDHLIISGEDCFNISSLKEIHE